jgi:hypothetical protein
MWDMDEIELKFNAGVLAFRDADFSQAERIFIELKQTGDDAVQNRAGLYLAVLFHVQFIPGVRTEENFKWLERMEAESRQVLANNPSQEYQDYAEGNIDAVQMYRRFDQTRKFQKENQC